MEKAALSRKPDAVSEAALAPGAKTPAAARAWLRMVKVALTTFIFRARPQVFLEVKGM